jgi:opacity protein-like surface antigen
LGNLRGFFATLRQIRLRTREGLATEISPAGKVRDSNYGSDAGGDMKSLKMFSAALAAGAIACAGAASAADMAVKAAPYAAPAPVFSWTGCYVGVHGGAGALLDQGFQGGGLQFFDKHGVGGLAGGQIGCNYQIGMLVLGIEGEGFWSGMKVTSDQFGGVTGSTLLSSASIHGSRPQFFVRRGASSWRRASRAYQTGLDIPLSAASS